MAEERSEARFCEGCAFFQPAPEWASDNENATKFGLCRKNEIVSKRTGYHLVSARFPYHAEYGYASVTRLNENECGPDAKWFEPKPSIQEAAE